MAYCNAFERLSIGRGPSSYFLVRANFGTDCMGSRPREVTIINPGVLFPARVSPVVNLVSLLSMVGCPI